MLDFVTICEKAARAGGAELLDWQGRFKVREKAPADLVTQADLASQEVIQRILTDAFPDHEFVGEEGAFQRPAADQYCWIVDPLDGTTNYVHGVPHYCVSVAVVRGGEIEAGAVLDPVRGDCFTAIRGGGAWINGEPIQTSSVTDLSRALLAASLPPKVRPESRQIAEFVAVAPTCQAIRRTGSAALNLCYVAAGRFDGYWATNDHAWDVAAGALIVREAGGIVTAPDGGPFDLWKAHLLAAAGPELHKQLHAVLRPYA